jgi:tRNA pseudouridine38-40 synthase
MLRKSKIFCGSAAALQLRAFRGFSGGWRMLSSSSKLFDPEPPLSDERQKVKRKVALTVGFVGSKYYGLQFNAHAAVTLPTIEEDVLRALHAAGYISDMNANKPTKVKLSRASRTDKGVHAVRTVLTLKLLVPKSQVSETHSSNTLLPHLPAEVNKHLPNDIRVFGAITTNAGFGGKNVSSI